jgi:DNA polymerase
VSNVLIHVVVTFAPYFNFEEKYHIAMDEIQQKFLDIVTQLRTHLEYQKALGVRVIEMVSPGRPGTVPMQAPRPVPAPEAEPSVKKPHADTVSGLAAVRAELGSCTRCKLHKGRTNIVFGEGKPGAVLVFVGEVPGLEEDREGRPFVGPAGQLLSDIIVKGMKLKREDVYLCNIVLCRPPDDRLPEQDEITACGTFLDKQLAAIHPRAIVALGDLAIKTLLNRPEGTAALRGEWQTYRGIPVMPTFHPAHLLRNPGDKKKVWDDIQKVMAKLGMKIK